MPRRLINWTLLVALLLNLLLPALAQAVPARDALAMSYCSADKPAAASKVLLDGKTMPGPHGQMHCLVCCGSHAAAPPLLRTDVPALVPMLAVRPSSPAFLHGPGAIIAAAQARGPPGSG
ncbi:DUF2946 family protein [Andreprevotia sp. IGB-42]|uniref:DUF2946 family protein n=1 Tax=Andreprevotia sp. IGB-42 TaxID=2497473 RepID=UPI0013578110|nr:DUF2946 family protein [Andreprevotia sp. IGB-42]